LRYRLKILRFIELRFRQASASPSRRLETTTVRRFCLNTPPEKFIPPLDQVAPRIQEILLQRQVNLLSTTGSKTCAKKARSRFWIHRSKLRKHRPPERRAANERTRISVSGLLRKPRTAHRRPLRRLLWPGVVWQRCWPYSLPPLICGCIQADSRNLRVNV